jgi:hypothetical protein
MNRNSKNFNLVEIIIAMGIIVVCLTTVMGLISAGMKISKDATMQAYSSIVVEQVIGMYETNPSIQAAIDAVPLSAATTTSDGVYTASTSGDKDILFKFGGSLDAGDTNDLKTVSDAENVNLESSTISGEDTTINVYQSQDSVNIFKITFQSKINGSTTVKDFSVIARIWIEPVTGLTGTPVSKGNNIIFDQKLKVEISWPPQAPYNNRLLLGNVLNFSKEL